MSPMHGTSICTDRRKQPECPAIMLWTGNLKEDEVIPIGRPFPNTGILLLNEDGKEVTQGEKGEICIRGTAVTMGYYRQPEKTAANFVQNPLNKDYPEIIYKTGDLGYYNDRGELMFASRKDYQIKHMGHRIELGEIEGSVNCMEKIAGGCCIMMRKRKKLYYFMREKYSRQRCLPF